MVANTRLTLLLLEIIKEVGAENVDFFICTSKADYVVNAEAKHIITYRHRILHTYNKDLTETRSVLITSEMSAEQAINMLYESVKTRYTTSLHRLIFVAEALQSILDLTTRPTIIMVDGPKHIPTLCTLGLLGKKYNPETAILFDDRHFTYDCKNGPACPFLHQVPKYTLLTPSQKREVEEFVFQAKFFPAGKYSFPEGYQGFFWLLNGLPSYSYIKPDTPNRYTGSIQISSETEENTITLDEGYKTVKTSLLIGIAKYNQWKASLK